MKISLVNNECMVDASNRTEKYKTESAFYYALRNALINMGFDVIKKNPQKDGHLTSAPYYIRERKGRFAIIDRNYAIRAINQTFNKDRKVALDFHY